MANLQDEELYELSDYEKEKLINFCGYGDFENADIVFLGNEEGLGGFSLPVGIRCRCKAFGNDWDSYLEANDWRKGYFEKNNIEADKNFKSEARTMGISVADDYNPDSPMLQFQARLMLYLSNPNQQWFLSKHQDSERYNDIIKYQYDCLYKEKQGLKSALLDFRPFPRRDESKKQEQWPYKNIDESQYIRAFQYKKNSRINDEYREIRNKRAELIKKLILKFNVPLIIGIGDKASKRNFFEQYFADDKTVPVFEEIGLTKDKVEVYLSEISYKQNKIVVILSDFFSNDYGIRVNGLEKLSKIVEKYIAK